MLSSLTSLTTRQLIWFSEPPFDNPEFDASFAGAFMGFVKSMDPNVHPVKDVITPEWALHIEGNTEMLFNKTESNEPNIHPFSTDPQLLERCK